MAELTARADRKVEIGLVQAVAAHAYGLSLQEIWSNHRVAARARQVAMYLAHVALKLGLRETGRGFERNHMAVAHACRRIEEAREDPVFDRTVECWRCWCAAPRGWRHEHANRSGNSARGAAGFSQAGGCQVATGARG